LGSRKPKSRLPDFVSHLPDFGLGLLEKKKGRPEIKSRLSFFGLGESKNGGLAPLRCRLRCRRIFLDAGKLSALD